MNAKRPSANTTQTAKMQNTENPVLVKQNTHKINKMN
jgi:hypothetical protein